MFCPNCGKQLPDGAKFCTACGKSLTGAAPEPAPAYTAPPSRQADYTQPAPAPAQPKKKSRAGLAVGIGLVAAVVLAAAVLIPRMKDPNGERGLQDLEKNETASAVEETPAPVPLGSGAAAKAEAEGDSGAYEALLAQYGIEHEPAVPEGVDLVPDGAITSLVEVADTASGTTVACSDYVHRGDQITAYTRTEYVDVTDRTEEDIQSVTDNMDSGIASWTQYPNTNADWGGRTIGDRTFAVAIAQVKNMEQMDSDTLYALGFDSLSMAVNEQEDMDRGALKKGAGGSVSGTVPADTVESDTEESGADPAYSAVFEGSGVIHLPILIAPNVESFAMKDENGNISCMDYGYTDDDLVTCYAETWYFLGITGDQQEYIQSLTEAAEQDAEKFSDVACISARYDYNEGGSYFRVRYDCTGLDKPENIQTMYDLGIVSANEGISMSLTEQELLSQGYVKR